MVLAPAESAAPLTPVAAELAPVDVQLFIMSMCPYSVQMLPTLVDAVQVFGDKVKLRVDYVGKHSDGKLSSMHGDDEVRADLAQVCAMKHTSRWLEMMLCQMEDYRSSDDNWRVCAKKLDLPARVIERCMGSDEGTQLLSRSFAVAKDKGVTGTPTLLINGVKYTGPRSKLAFTRKLCATLPDQAAAAPCAQLAKSPPIDVVLLTDGRCTDCNPVALESWLEQRIDNPRVTVVDYASDQGQALYAQLKPRRLPAFVFDGSIASDANVTDNVKKSLDAVGDKRVLVQGLWNPTCLDDKGCEQKECKLVPFCRSEKPKRLELYTMSKCTFGAKAESALKEVLEELKKEGTKVDLALYYIGSGSSPQLRSMHGPAEVEEDLRQVCVQKRYAKDLKFLDYVVCRGEDLANNDWQDCASELGLDIAAIEKCATGPEGQQLLQASFEVSSASGIRACPTWLANGKHKFSGLSPAAIKKGLCEHNKGMKGC